MRKRCLFFIVVFILSLAGCVRCESSTMYSRAEFAMSTVCTITLFDRGELAVYQEIFTRIREIESRMSVFIDGSELDRINKAAGLEALQVSADVFDVIERAVYFAELSGGAFDPTVGPLVALWDIGGPDPRPGLPRVPSQEEIDRVLPLINWRNIELNRENQTVFLAIPGMALDLGAIAKGYAADEAAAIIRNASLPQAIVNLGGNIMTIGEKPDGTPWRVGIQNPLEGRGVYLGIAQVNEKTIVTSGMYERFFEADGIHYHHIFSPLLGYPAHSGLMALTIIAENSMDADALSTAVFVLGYRDGLALIESFEGVEAIFVFEDRTVRLTEGVDFTLTDNYFTLVRD